MSRHISLTFNEPFQMVSDQFEPINNQNERRNFGFLDANRRAVFGQITEDGRTIKIKLGQNEMFNITISRAIGEISTVMARLTRLDQASFCLNDAYIIEERQILNHSINIPPNLEQSSNYLDIVLRERQHLSTVQIGFDNMDLCANAYFSSKELVFVMPSNCDHEIHFERAINNHAKACIPLVGKSIAQQFIHNYFENAMFNGQWNDVEEILMGLITHIGVQRYQRDA